MPRYCRHMLPRQLGAFLLHPAFWTSLVCDAPLDKHVLERLGRRQHTIHPEMLCSSPCECLRVPLRDTHLPARGQSLPNWEPQHRPVGTSRYVSNCDVWRVTLDATSW